MVYSVVVVVERHTKPVVSEPDEPVSIDDRISNTDRRHSTDEEHHRKETYAATCCFALLQQVENFVLEISISVWFLRKIIITKFDKDFSDFLLAL